MNGGGQEGGRAGGQDAGRPSHSGLSGDAGARGERAYAGVARTLDPAVLPSSTPALARGADARVWRLVDSGAPPRPGAENMAIDRALAGSVEAGGPAALRLYYWEPPCLSLGRNQPALGIYDPAAAALRGIDIVRRPTGGRAVLHYHELTYCVALPVGEVGSPRETYAAINRALVAGLRRLGVPALVVPERAGQAWASGPDAGTAPPWQALGAMPCFDTAAAGEVVAEGRKLIGSAQRREGRVLLQHGSLLLDDDQATVVELLLDAGGEAGGGARGPGELAQALERAARPATLRQLLGRAPAREPLERALAHGFEEELGIRLAPAALAPAEREAVGRWAAHFSSDAWTWRR